MKTILNSVILLAAVLTITSCNKTNSDNQAASNNAPAANQNLSETKTIVEIASADSRFTTLVAAVVAADLAGVLSSDGPFTVLAPTNDAFSKLPEGTVETLLKFENKTLLQSILLYHVVAGSVEAKTVISLDGQSVKTASGKEIKIKVLDGKVFINDSQVIITDIKAKNGIIHVIDSVLLP